MSSTARTLIREVREYVTLHRDPRTGIAWVRNGTTGLEHSAHANIHHTGSVAGMKVKGYWQKDARTVRSHGYIYNIDTLFVDDADDRTAALACQCGGACRQYQHEEGKG